MLINIRKYIAMGIMLAGVSMGVFAQEAAGDWGKDEARDWAQEAAAGDWGSNVLKIKYGWNGTVDPYLSPLRYNGQEIGIGNEWWREIGNREQEKEKREQGIWISVGKIEVAGSKAWSAAKSNYTYGLGAQGSWGALWDWSLMKDGRKYNSLPEQQKEALHKRGIFGFNISVGPELAVDVMARQHASNVNKPYSFDVGADILAVAGASLQFGGKKTAYRLRYMIRTNLIGADFVPEYWQSMYEVAEGQWKGDIRCSGPWNRNVVRQELTMDFQFIRSTWRLGVEHEWMNYRRAMEWNRQEVRIVVGCVWKYKIMGKAHIEN